MLTIRAIVAGPFSLVKHVMIFNNGVKMAVHSSKCSYFMEQWGRRVEIPTQRLAIVTASLSFQYQMCEISCKVLICS